MAQAYPFDKNKAFLKGPFNPFADEKNGELRGDPDDSAMYVLEPGANFLRPWISVPGGRAFVWPLGVEGFSLTIDPTLGIHKYIGDNAVKVDVVHKGEEHLSMTGTFPGVTSIDAFRALRDIVYADTPERGKILYIPHLFTYTQRVVVVSARFDRPEDGRGTDLSYTIDLVRLGPGTTVHEDQLVDPEPQGGAAAKTSGAKGASDAGVHRKFVVNGTYNTLRKIAALKLKSASKWRVLYDKNQGVFRRLHIPAHEAPNKRLPLGTVIYY